MTWRAQELNGEDVPISLDGQFKADRPGSFVITAEAGIHTSQEIVTVRAHAAGPHAPERLARETDGETRWDNKRLRTAFSEENRRGTNPVHSRLSTMVRSLRDLGELAAAGSSNFQLTVPVLDLPGRGLSLTLDLVYNSRLWHKSVDDQGISSLAYDIDAGWPAPGWSLGFGKLVRVGDRGDESMLVDGDGTRHPFRTVRKEVQGDLQTFLGQTTDGTLIDYSSVQMPQDSAGIKSAQVSYPNGTVVGYGAPGHAPVVAAGLSGSAEIYPASIMDANGNYITITYRNNTGPEIETITDTLGRSVGFHYDSQDLLTAITGPGLNGSTHTLIRLHYVDFPLAERLNFSLGMAFAVAVDPPVRSHYPLVDSIYYPATATGYWFADSDSFSDYGLVAKVSEQRAMGLMSAALTEQGTVISGKVSVAREYDYPLKADRRLTDAPAYSTVTETWADMDTPPAITSYMVQQSAAPRQLEVVRPDGQRTIELSYNRPLQFDDGLIYQSETYDASSPKDTGRLLQRTSLKWEQGDDGSPRVSRAEVTDELGQTAVTEYDYGPVHN